MSLVLSVGDSASVCVKCCWACVAACSKACCLCHCVFQGWLSWRSTPGTRKLCLEVGWDSHTRSNSVPASVLFCDALYRKRFILEIPQSYDTLFLLLVMLTSLQSQVSLKLTVQVLVCNTVLALWRCESAQLCKILVAGTALMTCHW